MDVLLFLVQMCYSLYGYIIPCMDVLFYALVPGTNKRSSQVNWFEHFVSSGQLDLGDIVGMS